MLRTFYRKSATEVVWYLIGVYMKKNITCPTGDMKFPSFCWKKRYSISLVHSTKQTMMFYLFRKISSQYGTEMLQTKQPQQELGEFLVCKFILKNHTISKSPPAMQNLLYIKLYYFGPLRRGCQSCIQGCH